MPSSIALLICTLFVLYMLTLDYKQFPDVSIVLWIPTIWFLIVSSKPVGIWFQSGGSSMEEGSPLDRLFLTVTLLLGVVILGKRRLDILSIITNNVWLIFLLGYMLLSCLWANAPYISFKRWTRELIAVVMVFVISSEPLPRKALECILRRSIYILIPFSYILIHYFSEYGRVYVHHDGDLMWVGVATHKNSLAQLCLASVFFLAWTFIRRCLGSVPPVARCHTYSELIIITLAVIMMGGPYHSFAYSATATVSGIIGLLFLAGFYHYKKRGMIPSSLILVIIVALIIFYGTITPILGKLSLIDISSLAGREEHLTGRADVWRAVIPHAMNRPFLGHGLDGFWTTSSREEFDITGAHNGFLDIILSLGFIGLGLYAIFLISNIRKAKNMMTHDFDWGVFWICSLVMSLLSNITESSFTSFTSRAMVPILCLSLLSTTPSSANSERSLKDN